MSDFSLPLSTHESLVIFFSLLSSWGGEWYWGFDGHLASIQGQNTTRKEKGKDTNQHWQCSFLPEWFLPCYADLGHSRKYLRSTRAISKENLSLTESMNSPKTVSPLCVYVVLFEFLKLDYPNRTEFFCKDWCCIPDFLYSSWKQWHTIVTNIKGPT